MQQPAVRRTPQRAHLWEQVPAYTGQRLRWNSGLPRSRSLFHGSDNLVCHAVERAYHLRLLVVDHLGVLLEGEQQRAAQQQHPASQEANGRQDFVDGGLGANHGEERNHHAEQADDNKERAHESPPVVFAAGNAPATHIVGQAKHSQRPTHKGGAA